MGNIASPEDVAPNLTPQPLPIQRLPVSEFEQIASAILPTAFAGGAFPTGVAVLAFTLSALTRTSSAPVDPFAVVFGVMLLAVVGFFVGYMYALFTGTLAALVVMAFHSSTKQRIHPRFLVQLVGGMAGFGSVTAFTLADSFEQISPGVVLPAILAMVMGMYATAYQYRSQYGNYQRGSDATNLQFGVREILVALTWVAISMAILRLFGKQAVVLFAAWIVVQLAAIAIGEGIRRLRIRNGWYRD